MPTTVGRRDLDTLGAVATWKEIEQAEPEFAGRVRQLFDAGRHKTIATLRADGSPRISGIECEFADGELRFGSMTGARKGADLKRDPRFALHGPTFHPEEGKESEWPGEAKIAGRAIAARRAAPASSPTARCSSPTSPRSSSPDSTPRPPSSSSSRGRPSEDCEGSSGTQRRRRPDGVQESIVDSTVMEWIPLGEGEWFKPLGFGPGGWRRLLLRLSPGVVVPRHRHRGEVHAFNLAGYRQIVGRDEVIGPGGYVYEPAGNVDSWAAVGDEDCIVSIVVAGAMEYLDDDDHVLKADDTESLRGDLPAMV